VADRPTAGRVTEEAILKLTPGTEILEVGEADLALVSDLGEVRLSGSSATVFRGLLAGLDGVRTLRELTATWGPEARQQAVEFLQTIVDAGLIMHAPGGDAGADPMSAMLDALGVDARTRARLGRLRVGIVGAEGPGAHAAAQLSAMRVGELVLVDPFPTQVGDQVLWPSAPTGGGVGRSRQAVVAELIRAGGTTVTEPLDAPFDRQMLRSALDGCDFIVHAFDRGHSASALWVNEHSLATRRPAVFGRLAGHIGLAGPMVIPGEGPCYLCSRMRIIANAADFEVAMGVEEAGDTQKIPRLAGRPGLPPVAAHLGALLALEVVKAALGLGSQALIGRLQVIDGLEASITTHPILQRPDCPACGRTASNPGGGANDAPGRDAGVGLAEAADSLVSDRTGIVRSLAPVSKDPSEPGLVSVVRAELANHRFVRADDEPFEVCSGKGLSPAAARLSALGEACERYAGARADPDRIVRAPRSDLNIASLDPVDLVLYAAFQYDSLPYSPWQPDLVIDWIDGRRLRDGEQVMVPALATVMHHEVHDHAEFLFPITSNGLAAGASFEAAALAALLEVIERDAFMISWLQQLPGRRIDATEVSDDVRRAATAYGRRGVSLELVELPTDAPATVIVALGVQEDGDGPAAVVGLGCDLDPVRACLKAALEIGQIRPALKARGRDPAVAARLVELLEDPSRVKALEDHDLLYSDRSMTHQLDFWRRGPPGTLGAAPAADSTAQHQLAQLVDGLVAVGLDPIAVDLSAAELVPLGIHAARGFVPTYQPIHFGANEARLGGTRLYQVPFVTGAATLATDGHGVNAYPHPLS
jgi:ribosomal protein S12 methylthiotransferase accessory factor